MKQLVMLSGKGGTGKTSITAAFAHLSASHSGGKAVLVDADVDCSNLELVLAPEVKEKHIFMGGQIPLIDPQLCSGCEMCVDACRFDALFNTPIVDISEGEREDLLYGPDKIETLERDPLKWRGREFR